MISKAIDVEVGIGESSQYWLCAVNFHFSQELFDFSVVASFVRIAGMIL
jgi:hypothetical protein